MEKSLKLNVLWLYGECIYVDSREINTLLHSYHSVFIHQVENTGISVEGVEEKIYDFYRTNLDLKIDSS